MTEKRTTEKGMKKTALVTGGAGFIGSQLCEALLKKGYAVIVVDNLSLGREENIKGLQGDFTFVKANVNDKEAMERIFSTHTITTVFHLAANSDIATSLKDPSIDFENTFRTTWSVLDLMRKHEVKKIVFASTSAVYGEAPGALHENFGPLQPVSHYGAGKLASEAFLSSFCANYGITTCIIRFPNVIGPKGTHGVILDFIKKLHADPTVLEVLGDGEQNKPYLHVSDLLQAILLVHERSTAGLNVYNVAGEGRTKVKTIARIVAEEMGLTPAIKYTGGARGWIGDVPEFQYDTRKIHALGWKPTMDSDAAVRRATQELLGK